MEKIRFAQGIASALGNIPATATTSSGFSSWRYRTSTHLSSQATAGPHRGLRV